MEGGEEVRVSMVLLTQGEAEELLRGPLGGIQARKEQMECWTGPMSQAHV